MKPLISILIPCYNGERFIQESIESCLNQTYKNIEIIFIDDGSTDRSLEIINNYASKDERIKVYSQENKGLGETRNILISYAKGEYFFFLDVDDIMSNNAIEKLYKNTENGKNNVVIGRTMCLINKFKFPFFPTWWKVKNMSVGHYIKSNICTPWGSIVKTSFFKTLNVNFIKKETFEDIGVMPYVYLKSHDKFKVIKDIVYNYRIKSGETTLSSFSHNYQNKIYSLYKQSDQVLYLLDKEGFHQNKEYRRYINGALYQILISIVFLSNNFSSKAKVFRNEFQISPRFNILYIMKKYGYKSIKFSKTFWKSLSFILIIFWYKKIIKVIKKNKSDDLTHFLNNFVIKNKNKYTMTKQIKESIDKTNTILFLDYKNLQKYIEYQSLNKKHLRKIIINFASNEELFTFIKENYSFFINNKIILGINMKIEFNWDIVLKYFSFVYSNNEDVLKYINKQELKLIVMSSNIKDNNLINYLLEENENI